MQAQTFDEELLGTTPGAAIVINGKSNIITKVIKNFDWISFILLLPVNYEDTTNKQITIFFPNQATPYFSIRCAESVSIDPQIIIDVDGPIIYINSNITQWKKGRKNNFAKN